MAKSKKGKPKQPKPAAAPKTAPHHGRNAGDKISGDRIVVECRSHGDWKMFRMSGTHNGWKTTAKKNATAEIISGYTNIQK